MGTSHFYPILFVGAYKLCIPVSETRLNPYLGLQKPDFCYLENAEREQNTVACIRITRLTAADYLLRRGLSQMTSQQNIKGSSNKSIDEFLHGKKVNEMLSSLGLRRAGYRAQAAVRC